MKNPCSFLHVLMCSLISILVLSGCCRDKRHDIPGKQCEPRPDEHYFYGLNEGKDYMYFKKGTWWIYKNVNTGLIDTLTVYDSKFDTITSKGQEEASYYRIYTYEKAVINVRSYKYKYFYTWYSREKNPDATGIATQGRSWVLSRSQGYLTPCFATPLELHHRTDVDLVTRDTTIQIGAKIYQDVQVFKIFESRAYYDILDPIPSNNSSYSLMYYAKNLGLIKHYKFYENVTIELIESNIIQ
jgi:hypothetical protein